MSILLSSNLWNQYRSLFTWRGFSKSASREDGGTLEDMDGHQGSAKMLPLSVAPAADLPVGEDSLLLSMEGLRLSQDFRVEKVQAPEVAAVPKGGRQIEDPAKLLPTMKNADVEGYAKRAVATMNVMKELAQLAQKTFLTREDRLALDKELTHLQTSLAKDTARTRAKLNGQNEGGRDTFIDDNEKIALTVLQREFDRQGKGLDPSEFVDNGDGTSTVTIITAPNDITRMTGKHDEVRQEFAVFQKAVLGSNNEHQTTTIKRLSHEDFLEYSVLSLRDVKSAERAEKFLDDKLKALQETAGYLCDVDIDRRSDGVLAQAGPDARRSQMFDPLFKQVEALWKVLDLWPDAKPGLSTMYVLV